ncbi:hypothetical protein RvY_13923 [Ramazzottius varieornatus]|uniref:Dolichyl-diphosphooligosaccharide--protein glycosyltransferase subunit 2 n=1 Tax=Ramazzottius varieornatus TaxID=947166 RepID=A0A1D1VWY4_RAMVA|nr:hypothetical protein RvY_13923 [Ramazzottius varieornatus]
METYLRLCSLCLTMLLTIFSVQGGQGMSKETPVADKPAAKAQRSSSQVQVSISDIEVSIYDSDAGKASLSQKISLPNKLSSIPNVPENQKLVVKFTVRNQADNQPVKADQTFLRLTNGKVKEVVLVAEADGDSYKVEVDLSKRAAEFARLSGQYDVRIEVGDVNIAKAVSANLGSVKLSFPGGVDNIPDPLARFAPKPEIKHTFREPEKRPPALVSTAFSFAVLAPMVVLWALWARLGINFRNFDLHPTSLVFYGSLGAIFYLYYMFWIFLDMFTTLKYLTVLGAVAFFSGNAMFARLHRRRHGKEIKE